MRVEILDQEVKLPIGIVRFDELAVAVQIDLWIPGDAIFVAEVWWVLAGQ